MTDPRVALRAVYAQWLRVRANVRALETSLAAAEYALQRDARRTDDSDMATLVTQLASERRAIVTLARELDARIADVKRDCQAIETGHVEALVAAARLLSNRAR